MRSAGLDGLAILHHGLDREGVQRAGETLARSLLAGDGGDGEMVPEKMFIDLVHLPRLNHGLV